VADKVSPVKGIVFKTIVPPIVSKNALTSLEIEVNSID